MSTPPTTPTSSASFPPPAPKMWTDAVAAAKKAFATWRLVPAPKRAEILFRAGRLLQERKEKYARDMTREMGKVLAETRGDVQEAIDEAFYVAGEGRRLFGDTTPSELQNKFAMSVRMPVGVVGLITPWNFPMAIPSWKLFPALVAGNTCVIKPATDTPLSTYNLVQALVDAGLPPGVVNIVCGGGPAPGSALVEHPDVRAISFTGSSEVGSHRRRSAPRPTSSRSRSKWAARTPRSSSTTPTSNSRSTARSGAHSAPPASAAPPPAASCCRRASPPNSPQKFVARAKALKIGNGLDESVQVGPQVNASADRNLDEVRRDREEGRRASSSAAATRSPTATYANGTFFEPTVFAGVTPAHAHRPRRSLRPRRLAHRIRHLRAGHRDRQLHRLRPLHRALHART